MASETKPKPKAPQSEPPPSKINVQKLAKARASELASLHSVIATRLDGDFRSDRSKRRRTTSHESKAASRRRKIRRRNSMPSVSGDDEPKLSRRARRREELKMKSETGFCTSGDGTRRLRTHVWHAKRFAMTKLWGFHLPLGLHGRGRGSRALLKRFRDGVLVHDSSYHVAVQLEGPEAALLSILNMVLVPSPSACSSDAVLSGTAYGNAMLHCIGGQSSKAIAPVTYMWQHCLPSNNRQEKKSDSTTRCLWVWIHASALSEGYDALKTACQKEMDKRGISINCFSLEDQLAKLEVLGSKAFQLLQSTLIVAGISESSLETEKHSVGEVDNDSCRKKTSILDNIGQLSAKAVVSLCVMDPHTITKKRKTVDFSESTSCDTHVDVPEHEVRDHIGVEEISDRNKEPFSFLSEHSVCSSVLCRSLWLLSSGVVPPVEESALCKEKQELRKTLYCINAPISTEVQSSRCCPILLLKNESKNGLSVGWSVILPLSWVKAFWVPLISNGAHAIGLREKHWVSCEVGLPCFPSDFPDCNAYLRLKAIDDAASNKKLERRASALRPLKVPIPSPWNCVRFLLNRILTCIEDPEVYRVEKQDSSNSSPISELVDLASSLDGFVARTSNSLANFMNEIKGNHLLLFPRVADRETCFQDMPNKKSRIQDAQNRLVNNNHKLCFLRVLLHAYKDGFFEEGAVVCAPHLGDIKLWTSSLVNGKERLQLPHSVVTTYFREQSSGRWELQIPEDSAACEHLRLPIGFVTTGFVRGSKKLVAEAFCEAVLLAHLRKEQWNSFPIKRQRKEVFVLVRNLRSTAYRLALATIVLEQQEEDSEFL